MAFIRDGLPPESAYEKTTGTYGRFSEAVKIIDPRKSLS